MEILDWLSGTKTFQKVDELFSSQVTNLNPDTILILLQVLLYSAILWIILFGGIHLYKKYKAPGSDMIKEYKENLQITSEDSKQKSIILTLLHQVNGEIKDFVSSGNVYNHDYGGKIINMIVQQIPLAIKSNKSVNHRCAVFIKDNDETSSLKILEGCGYSVQGKENLRLKIENSIAGTVFTGGEYKYIKDLRKQKNFKPHPKSSKTYYSLICIPIVINGVSVGVLSVDGSEVDCFTKDDIHYFKVFATQLGILFSLMNYNEYNDEKGADQNGEIQITG
ncbi:GAF domain-containing protein [Sutcliffiella horikoshii]|uniref:GAF domain-containing protein n=1 Tax=Sutcliffiella horikoshii TaxID=79883 RepID=UPI003CF1E913